MDKITRYEAKASGYEGVSTRLIAIVMVLVGFGYLVVAHVPSAMSKFGPWLTAEIEKH